MLDFGLHLAGLEHAWLCEVDPWRRSILERRFPGVPVLDDIRTLGAATARPVDVIAGGFPCKGASTAGLRSGFEHPETILWREMLRSIRELRPRYVLVENVANLLRLRPPGGEPGDLWREVLGGLSECGFDVVWDVLPAAAVGAPHLRERVFAIAVHPGGRGWGEGERDLRAGQPDAEGGGEAVADADGEGRPARRLAEQAVGGVGSERRRRERRTEGSETAAHPGRDGVRQQPEPEPGCSGAAESRQADPPAADAPESRNGPLAGGTPRETEVDGSDLGLRVGGGRGVAVEWGDFGPAIRRWESAFGPAPEPLVRRVDDGATRRVERSRLSALGDGVQVQVGYLAGRYIVERERERERVAA